jgi:ABC-type nickel/cobalt efflux system permease component RcnA
MGMLVAAVRHSHRHRHPHPHPHGHGHGHDHGHRHGRPTGWLGLAGIGVAGGLVPSPSALVVLLASVGTGRAVVGVLLVLAYGLGMAGTLTAAGLLLLAVQRRISVADTRPARLLTRLGAAAPVALPLTTSAVVLLVGAGMAVRAAAGLT